MRGEVLQLGRGEVGFGDRKGEVVKGVCVEFRDTGAQERANEVFEAFEFGLQDYEAEVGAGVRVAGCVFDELDLADDEY